MKIGKSHSTSSVSEPGIGIDKANYRDRAMAFIRGRGGEGFIIRARDGEKGSARTGEPATEAQWVAWRAYLGGLGVPMAFMTARGETIVPSEWPEDFDAMAPTSDRAARLPRPWPVDAGKREWIAAELNRLSRGLPPAPAPKPEAWRTRTEDQLREYGSQPLRIGATLARKLKDG